jgi:hypothetical protein
LPFYYLNSSTCRCTTLRASCRTHYCYVGPPSRLSIMIRTPHLQNCRGSNRDESEGGADDSFHIQRTFSVHKFWRAPSEPAHCSLKPLNHVLTIVNLFVTTGWHSWSKQVSTRSTNPVCAGEEVSIASEACHSGRQCTTTSK